MNSYVTGLDSVLVSLHSCVKPTNPIVSGFPLTASDVEETSMKELDDVMGRLGDVWELGKTKSECFDVNSD